MIDRLQPETQCLETIRGEPHEPSASSPELYQDIIRPLIHSVEQTIVAHPGKSLAIAAGTGFLLTWMIKRR